MRLLLANRARLIRAAIYLSCTVFFSFSFATELKVDLPADQIALEYQSSVRLEQVLNDITQRGTEALPNRYPLANQLFNLDKQEQVEQLKLEVSQELQVLAAKRVLPKESAGIIREQINSWNIAYRELIELDLDQIRTHVPSNPMLQGHFEFLSPMRSQVLSFEGLLFSPQQVEFDSSTPLSSYLNKLNLLSSAHPSYAWVVYPNGDYVRAGYAYWNNQGTQLAPGTIVFVGFNSEAREVRQLEERIVKLITMRRSTK